ncbi:unnamed protein product [Ectocarpus sp. CCAP 1310/34]|nr:unnamed protein product [Ectocarpus sp. CCAP 1310/34]
MGRFSTTVLASTAVSMLTQDVNAFLAVPSTAPQAVWPAPSPSSVRRWNNRPRPRAWMSEGSGAPATTRRDMFQAAGAAIAATAMGLTAVPVTRSAGAAVTEGDRKGVEQTTIRWKEMVTLGTPDAPRKTADLYAVDGVLWGTVSEEVRDTPEEIYDYFDYFARLPNLRLSEFTPVSLRVYGDFATEAGTYTFKWQGEDGVPKEKRARFSFTFRSDPESPTSWTIVEHHSSSMPTSPLQLKHVR